MAGSRILCVYFEFFIFVVAESNIKIVHSFWRVGIIMRVNLKISLYALTKNVREYKKIRSCTYIKNITKVKKNENIYIRT
jgi:hypothetical protein